MTKRAKPIITAEEREQQQLAELRNRFNIPTANRTFTIGQQVEWGGHPVCTVVDTFDDDKIIKIDFANTGVYAYVCWLDLFPVNSEEDFSYDDPLNLTFFNFSVSSLIDLHYNAGIDYDAEYQRAYVWTLADQRLLLDSIFNNIEIGKFVLIFNGYEHKPIFEMLDGKQRLLTLVRYFEDQFSWHGHKFSQLSHNDRRHFDRHMTTTAKTQGQITRAVKLKYFLKLNTMGVPQDPEHLHKVRQMYLDATRT